MFRKLIGATARATFTAASVGVRGVEDIKGAVGGRRSSHAVSTLIDVTGQAAEYSVVNGVRKSLKELEESLNNGDMVK